MSATDPKQTKPAMGDGSTKALDGSGYAPMRLLLMRMVAMTPSLDQFIAIEPPS